MQFVALKSDSNAGAASLRLGRCLPVGNLNIRRDTTPLTPIPRRCKSLHACHRTWRERETPMPKVRKTNRARATALVLPTSAMLASGCAVIGVLL